MWKILTTMLAFMTLLSFTACSDADMHQELNKNEEITAKSLNGKPGMEADASHQWEANEKLTHLIESFGTTRNRFQEEVPKYPEYYGGAYITEQGGLTILLHGDQRKGKQAVNVVIGSSSIEFREAQYSYVQLNETMDRLNDFVINRTKSDALGNFNLFSLMDSENRIVVYLNDYSDSRIEEFKKNVSNSPAITFQKSEGEMMFEANLYPGCKAAVNVSGTSYGSYGFRAKRNSDNVVGMVTAGHVISAGGILYEGGVSIGTCSMSKIVGTVDVAFVPITNPSTYVPSNTICGTSNLLSTSTSLPGVGTLVNQVGASTNATSGNIISTNTTWTSPTSGNTLTNITSAGYTSAGGDSGGIVYTYVSSTGTRYTVGTHIGAIGSTRYYTKADQALSALGVSLY